MARAPISGRITWKDNDRGYRELKSRLQRTLDGMSISAGVQGAEANQREESGATVGEVAGWAEFGTTKQPPRPFLGTAFEKHGAWRSLLARAGREIVDGKSPKQAFDEVSKQIVKDIREVIETGSGRFVPLADTTVAWKGHSRPLIEDGQLLDSITAVVVKK